MEYTGRNLAVFVAVASLCVAWTSARETQQLVACIEDVTHAAELYLDCGQGGVVNIITSQYGFQDVPQDDLFECRFVPENDCAVNATRLSTSMGQCMGQKTCILGVRVPEQDLCGQINNYYQVEYECLPDNTMNALAVLDICGDALGDIESITRTGGYIESLNYPDVYSPDTMCSCTLTATDPNATIRLTMVDLDLSAQQAAISTRHDWLEFATDVTQWGEGRKMNYMKRNEMVDTEQATVYLNFRSDGLEEGRGFWMQYEAQQDGGASSSVQVQCGAFIPPLYKKGITCMEPPHSGELYLSCRSQGIINVLYAVRGYRADQEHRVCPLVVDHDCAEDVSDWDDLLQACMGQADCYVSVQSARLADCLQDTNYVQVQYQCIQDESHRMHTITDICGDSLDGISIERTTGYLENLGYPNNYFPNTQCTCRLRTMDPEAYIIMYLMDVHLDGEDCHRDADWVEYVDGEQEWGRGTSLCGQDIGEPIYAEQQKIYVNFRSNAATEGRGVWLKYLGKNQDGSRAPVKVSCGQYVEGEDLPENDERPSVGGSGGNVDRGTPQSSPTPGSSAGLIAGLTVVAVLMLLVVAAMVFYRYRKFKSASVDSGSSVGSISVPPANRFDSGYGTLRHPHPTMINTTPKGLPYTNLDNESSLSGSGSAGGSVRGKLGVVGGGRTGVGSGVLTASGPGGMRATFPASSFFPHEVRYMDPSAKHEGGTSSAYLNPTFDGSLDEELGDGLPGRELNAAVSL